jgi:hypothetical protein
VGDLMTEHFFEELSRRYPKRRVKGYPSVRDRGTSE